MTRGERFSSYHYWLRAPGGTMKIVKRMLWLQAGAGVDRRKTIQGLCGKPWIASLVNSAVQRTTATATIACWPLAMTGSCRFRDSAAGA
jgi:hypothetical protein